MRWRRVGRNRWGVVVVRSLCVLALMVTMMAGAAPAAAGAPAGGADDRPERMVREAGHAVTGAVQHVRQVRGGTGITPGPWAVGRWRWPVPGPEVLLRAFDGPAQPWLPGHRGVDLAGRPGSPVSAVADGEVAFSGSVAGVGVVSVRHGSGLVSTYQPVRSHLRRGAPVVAGTRLGRLSPGGSHCQPSTCLHLGARRGQGYVDPMLWLRPVRVSLLAGTARQEGGRS